MIKRLTMALAVFLALGGPADAKQLILHKNAIFAASEVALDRAWEFMKDGDYQAVYQMVRLGQIGIAKGNQPVFVYYDAQNSENVRIRVPGIPRSCFVRYTELKGN